MPRLLLVIKKLKKYQYKEQQRIISAACVNAALSMLQYADRTVIVKQQQKDQNEKEYRTVFVTAAEFAV